MKVYHHAGAKKIQANFPDTYEIHARMKKRAVIQKYGNDYKKKKKFKKDRKQNI